ncbi:glutamine--fructose-6-phosphate transaminase (isomerizing) [Chloroflexota bacterium]
MCGIIGFLGKEPAAPFLLSSLTNLEYRGYDSAGAATIADGTLSCRKGTGKLSDVREQHCLDDLPGDIGIGHVRWATHGSVTDANSHPHIDCKNEIAIVHNGIIDNHDELRAQLQPRHVFRSETDSEVISHLIEEYMDSGASLKEAVLHTTGQLRGSYAFIAISIREPEKMVAARRDSPLVVGTDGERKFVASDTLAFLQYTNNVAFVEDGETVVLGEDIVFLDGDGKQKEKEFAKIDWKWDQATKQGHDYFMIKEIWETPAAISHALEQDEKTILQMAIEILRARQVVFTACGTSRYAALVGRYLFSKLGGKFCDVIMGSEFHYFSDSVDRNTLVVAISQSGETADIIQGVKKAKENGATVFAIVNMVGSSLARMSDGVLYLNCGPEIGVAATKSFLSQLAILYLLAFTMANRREEGMAKIKDMCSKVDETLRRNGVKLEGLAERTKGRDDFYFIARGINFAIAAEGALKLKEISYIHAEGMPAGELKHGTLALIEEGTPVVVICPKDYTFEETLANAAETKARGAYVIGVSEEWHPLFDEWIEIHNVEEIFYPLVTIVPLQLLAYYLSVARGQDPDKPRNLAKSVTVK